LSSLNLSEAQEISFAYTQDKFDLTFELTGSPSALNDAIEHTAFSGRIVIGSWYGQKRAEIDLGGAFHRSRIKLIASQVSTISPELSGRWDKLFPPLRCGMEGAGAHPNQRSGSRIAFPLKRRLFPEGISTAG
jgi:hypothetical protein